MACTDRRSPIHTAIQQRPPLQHTRTGALSYITRPLTSMPRHTTDCFDEQGRDTSNRSGSDAPSEGSPNSVNQQFNNNRAESDSIFPAMLFGRSDSHAQPRHAILLAISMSKRATRAIGPVHALRLNGVSIDNRTKREEDHRPPPTPIDNT